MFPAPTSETGGPSNYEQAYPLTHEPPHHTVPLLVAVANNQEHRLSQVETGLMEVPRYTALHQVSNHVHTLETRFIGVTSQLHSMTHLFGLYKQATNSLMDREVELANDLATANAHLTYVMNEVEAVRNRRIMEERKAAEMAWKVGQLEHKVEQLNIMVQKMEAYLQTGNEVPRE